MRILGLDPGSRHTGFGIVEKHSARIILVAAGRHSPPAAWPLARRLEAIHAGVSAQIQDLGADVIAVEDLFVALNPRSAMVLAQVRGVILLAAAQAGLEAASYAPRLVKQTVAGNGGAEKPQVAWMVARLLGIPEADLRADASDALAVALCHAAHVRQGVPLTSPGPALAAEPGGAR